MLVLKGLVGLHRTKITLKDDSGKVQKEMTQKVENLKSSRTKILQVGIIGNYSYIKNVEFEIK